LSKINVKEATRRLNEVNLTSNQEVVRRWIRQGKIKASKLNKASGYDISSFELEKFIRKRLLIEAGEYPDYDKGFKDGYAARKTLEKNANSRGGDNNEILRK